MKRHWLVLALFGCTAAYSNAATAQSTDCPDGSWFCSNDDTETPPETAPSEPAPSAAPNPPAPSAPSEPAPSAAPNPPAPGTPPRYRAPRATPRPQPAGPPTVYVPAEPPPPGAPPVVIFQPVIPAARPAAPVPPPYPPPTPPQIPPRYSEWGLQFRIEGVALGENAPKDSGMGGVGLSLRPRPSPWFALDIGVDALGGKDFNGFRRSETSFTVNPMVFLNPRRRVQVYLLAGFGFSSAKVQTEPVITKYHYFGVNAGIGLEIRLSRSLALSGDALAFVRARTDPNADKNPEFTDARTGKTTNASGGGLLRLGLTYYW